MFDPNELAQFYGTEKYYRHWTRKLVWTDGIQYLQDGAGWLLDAIASYQGEKSLSKDGLEDFQLWELKVKDSKAVLTCRADSDEPAVVEQLIEYTDFPMEYIKIYVERGSLDGKNECMIAMLPSER